MKPQLFSDDGSGGNVARSLALHLGTWSSSGGGDGGGGLPGSTMIEGRKAARRSWRSCRASSNSSNIPGWEAREEFWRKRLIKASVVHHHSHRSMARSPSLINTRVVLRIWRATVEEKSSMRHTSLVSSALLNLPVSSFWDWIILSGWEHERNPDPDRGEILIKYLFFKQNRAGGAAKNKDTKRTLRSNETNGQAIWSSNKKWKCPGIYSNWRRETITKTGAKTLIKMMGSWVWLIWMSQQIGGEMDTQNTVLTRLNTILTGLNENNFFNVLNYPFFISLFVCEEQYCTLNNIPWR